MTTPMTKDNAAAQVTLMDPREFHYVIGKLRAFFDSRGFVEAPVQHRLSILAACEDPRTVASFDYAGTVWPLPQTGQMWLEWELLNKPSAQGFYCQTTSYRNEPNPIPGRHDRIFQMFEFEMPGNLEILENTERDLLAFLGFDTTTVSAIEYEDAADRFGVRELEAEHEERMWKEISPACLLRHFPLHTSPFWNMKRNGELANKIDVILCGMESIGSAERSIDAKEMKHAFHTISDGLYADMLFSRFGKARVQEELSTFLSLNFFTRCGGGVGMNRLIRAMKLMGLMPSFETVERTQEAVATV